jgi:CheY-like chemotaxis protein
MMLNILIVDDSESNQMVIESALEDFSEATGSEFSIEFAINGAVAVEMCEAKNYHIVFMDVMMPVMDGIEATRHIHALSPKTMIVAVTASGDPANQKGILQAGAEDYIHKPIDMVVFMARIKHYCFLAEVRKSKALKASASVRNCINKNVLVPKILFQIENEDQLAEFWEYCLFNLPNNGDLSDAVRTLYLIASYVLEKEITPEIAIEYTHDTYYFTMSDIENFNEANLRSLLGQHLSAIPYKIVSDRFSIAVRTQEGKKGPETPPIERGTPSPRVSESAITPKPREAVSQKVVCDYISPEELIDIKEYLGSLTSLLLVVSSGEIEVDEIKEIAFFLDHIGKVATLYSESYSIGIAITNLSRDIDENVMAFQAKSSLLGEMCVAYGEDLSTWVRLVFEEGTNDVNCMDESIIFNSMMISQTILGGESPAEQVDLDEIFDF